MKLSRLFHVISDKIGCLIEGGTPFLSFLIRATGSSCHDL
jgi:hypothetical protein